jgi:KipI family sensor histidine kinase inhibitor
VGDRWALRPAGERGLLVEVGADDPTDLPARVAVEVRHAAVAAGIELQEVVPGAVTVLCVAGSLADLGPLRSLLAHIHEQRMDISEREDTVGHGLDALVIDVVYDGADLAQVAAETGLSIEEVVARHRAGRYQAAFTGFAPGFAYLSGLDPLLEVPRLAQPRPVVPAGSVAVADRYSAVYPRATPGGWRLLGRTAVTVWDPARLPPALLTPGVPVRFRDVTGS